MFQPVGTLGKLRHLLLGQWLMQHEFWRVSRRSPRDSAERDGWQRSLGHKLLGHLQVKLEVTGLDHIGGGPYLIASLHEGIADVLCLTQLPIRQRFVARDEIFGWETVGPALTALGHLSICPEKGAQAYRHLTRQATRVLSGGESLTLFPQGSVLGLETDFQKGVFHLAKLLNVPILPVVLTGTHRIWEHPFSPTLRYGQRVQLQVLPPVLPEALHQKGVDTVRLELQRAMKRIALQHPHPRRYLPDRDGYWDGFHFEIDPDFREVHRQVQEHRKRWIGETA